MKTQIFHITDPAAQREEIEAAAEIIRGFIDRHAAC